jgi:hypothetical protein
LASIPVATNRVAGAISALIGVVTLPKVLAMSSRYRTPSARASTLVASSGPKYAAVFSAMMSIVRVSTAMTLSSRRTAVAKSRSSITRGRLSAPAIVLRKLAHSPGGTLTLVANGPAVSSLM